MNKKGQDFGKIIEAIFSIIFLFILTPVLISILYSASHPHPEIVVNNTAVEQAQSLSQQFAICQENYNQLKNSTVTKGDLQSLVDAISQINKNVINIYQSNSNYINNYFIFTIQITIALTIVFSIGIITFFDWTIFKFELAKGFFRAVKRRLSQQQS